MEISNETLDRVNYLIGKSFECNAQADNFAYNIDYSRYPLTGNIYHHSFAHIFPQLADILSGMLIKLDARPVRHAIPAYDTDYAGNLVAVFKDNLAMCEDYRQDIIQTIEIAEYNGDYEVKLEMEDFLVNFMKYRKQADIWAAKAVEYEGNEKSFDARIKTFTTFIPIITEDD